VTRSIPVFYSDKLLAESASFSPSAGKPKPVIESWRTAGLPIEVRAVDPATIADLCLAHDRTYVTSILDCTALNGFGNKRPDVARSLPYTTGAMINAACTALGYGVACAPVSGFHHAGYSSALGFCTFNGLMVTAIKLLNQGKLKRVLILDLDQHYGNGTDDIIERLKLSAAVTNLSFGAWYGKPRDAPVYLERLRAEVEKFKNFDLILYQAGADLHVDDPLGGVLNNEQMRERDRIVFEAAKDARVPLVWDLAGGYQDPISKVVRIHMATMEECVRAYVMNRSADPGRQLGHSAARLPRDHDDCHIVLQGTGR
jgi:acetoin utilization deacetylase AcuC-like enzyme